MKRALRQISKAVFALGDRLAPPLSGPRLLIYHQIGGGSGLEMEVSPNVFQRHLDWLAEHAPVVPFSGRLEGEPVVITFDDGYRSLYETAYPLLKERGLPFTLFLTTQPIESGEPLRDHSGADPLTWDMVREMLDSGLMTLGAHTHSHPDFRHLGAREIEMELERSDSLITERTGVTPRHFAYTWGYWSPQADGLVRSRYETAVLGGAPPFGRTNDPHLAYRVPIQLSDGTRWFPPRVRGGLLWEEAVRRRLRGYQGP